MRDPSEKPRPAKKSSGGCSTVAMGDAPAALLLVAAFVDLRRRKTHAA